MTNFSKKVTSVLLLAALLLGCLSAAAHAADTPSLTLLCANVAGLPIPVVFSGNRITVPETQRLFGQQLNKSGAQIVCVQEDFQFHDLLAKQMTAYPYQTYTSGGIPAGDGLNVFSQYPIYSVERVAWTEFYGILKHDNDALTPKGFLKCTVDVGGVLVDLYNIHTDASKTMEDQHAKKAQFEQLCSYIDAHSAGRPVLITGDFNCTLHTYYYAEFYETMIDGAQFSDAWVEFVNGGNYLRGDDAEEVIARYHAQYNNEFWGLWDSYERLIYRSGDGVSFTPTDFGYTFYTDGAKKPSELSDHAVMHCTVRLAASDYTRPDTALTAPQKPTAAERFTYTVRMVLRCLRLIANDLIHWAFYGKELT